jgi:RNA polymerase sigma factor (TIGR02999 family)
MDEAREAAEQALAEALGAVEARRGAPASELLPLVYELLRHSAQRMLGQERQGHTLTPTSLVHEAYLRVAERVNGFESRRHFFNAAAQAMRRILIEHGRARGRLKRRPANGAAPGPGDVALEAEQPITLDTLDWLALDEALTALAERDERRHQVVMLRFFAGLAEAEVAELLGVDERTVRRDWVTARLWLYSQLSGR